MLGEYFSVVHGRSFVLVGGTLLKPVSLIETLKITRGR